MGYRWSGVTIVPKKVGNATGGKRKEGCISHLYYAKPYQRGNIYEDKLVQEALRRILGVVFEHHFYDEMMGFRRGDAPRQSRN